ncbi:radical SAM family heme chaperone HemW [Fusibacter bizertensis]
MTVQNQLEPISIYIHIPFCVSKCAYCDFISHRVGDFEINGGVQTYFNALEMEIALYKELLHNRVVRSIYIGGGTPSSVDGKYIHNLINQLKAYASFSNDIEITLEVNPGTLTEDKLNHYVSAGVNRISMGLQTTNDQLLHKIGRIHSTNDFITSYEAVKRAGIGNISLDLMFGLPGQTLLDIENAISLVARLAPSHVSAYSLKIEEGTPLNESYINGQVQLPDEELERDMYHKLISGLKEIDIHQYELSNFSKYGYESKHNLVYWENKPYLGLGVSSHSKINNERFANTNLIYEYSDMLKAGKYPIIQKESIDKSEDLFESIILGLRLNKGIALHELNAKYEIDFHQKYKNAIEVLIQQGLIEYDDHTIRLTIKGMDLSNQVFLRFMED